MAPPLARKDGVLIQFDGQRIVGIEPFVALGAFIALGEGRPDFRFTVQMEERPVGGRLAHDARCALCALRCAICAFALCAVC